MMKRKESKTLHGTNNFESMRFAGTDAMHDMENDDSNGIENQVDEVSARNCLEVPRVFGASPSNVYKEPGGIII